MLTQLEEHFSKVSYSLESNPFGYEVQIIDAKSGKLLVTHTEMATAFLLMADSNGWYAKPGYVSRPGEHLIWGNISKVANVHLEVWTYDVRDILEFLDLDRNSVIRKRRRQRVLIFFAALVAVIVFAPTIFQ
jgi:hypothetical protein